MGMFDDAIEFLARVEDPKEERMNSRRRLTARQAERLRSDFPGVPEEFIAYLREVGAGSFRECQFMIYGMLGTPDQILGQGVMPQQDPTVRILCFGDNYSGNLSGFLPDQRWAVAELWHGSGTLSRVKKPFGKYIRERMLMGPRGEDLRER
jgi:hypothetical protein